MDRQEAREQLKGQLRADKESCKGTRKQNSRAGSPYSKRGGEQSELRETQLNCWAFLYPDTKHLQNQ